MKRGNKLNIVVDANWYISACISRKSRRTLYYEVFKNPKFQVFYSTELMNEFSGVMERPKFAKIITHKQVNRFRIIALKFLLNTKIKSLPDLVRDAKDN